MKAADLRKSILQAAVQGKLVPQNPHDEPAAALLARIRAEKTKLANEGKFKKEKPLPPISENKIPYDLPDGWEWCKLGILGDVLSSKRVFTSEFVDNGIPFYRGTEIGALATGQERVPKYYITESHYHELACHTGKPVIGDLLMPSICPDGRIWLVDSEEPFYFKDGRVLWVRLIKGFLNNRYIQQALKARLISDYANIASGTTFAELKIFLLKEITIPLPPFAEQERIVAKLNELIALCDELDAAEKELNALESNFAEYLPKSILQAAVQGKLVPQNIHDESADKLLERIKAEKAKLVKSGKLKKEKPLPPITEDEIPFDLPEGWAWSRLNDLCEYVQRGKSPTYSDEKRIPVLSQKCVQWSGVTLEKAKFIAPCSIENYGKERFIKHNDLLWNSTGHGTLGRIGIIDTFKEKFSIVVADSHVTVVRCLHQFMLAKYLLIWFSSPHVQSEIVSKSNGSTNQIELATSTIKEYIVPFPPLAEQQRIVSKVNELMSLCDALKAAHDAPVGASIAATVIPFPHQEEEPEMLMAARGVMPKAPSKALQDARNRLFED